MTGVANADALNDADNDNNVDFLNNADNNNDNVDFLNTKIEATHLTTALSFAGMFSLERNPELYFFLLFLNNYN